MALAVMIAVMGDHEGHPIHPFFNSTRVKGPAEASGSDTTSHVLQPVSTQCPNSQQVLTTNGAERPIKSRRTRKSKDSEKSAHLQSTQQIIKVLGSTLKNETCLPAMRVVSSTADDRSEEQSQDGESADLEVDLNQDRRKRRRSASPKARSWDQQLREAASYTGTTDVNRSTQGVLTLNGFISDELPEPLEPGEKPIDVEVVTFGATLQAGQQVSPGGATPQRRMLKLRNDGKLISPTNKPSSGISNLRRTEKGGGKNGSPMSKIAILKYGHDDRSRKSIANNIQEVLAGNLKIERVTSITEDKSRSSVKPQDPPKSTHPFFLNKLVRKSDTAQSTDHSGGGGAPTVLQPRTKIESFVNPRKKLAAASGDWVDDRFRMGGLSADLGVFQDLKARRIPSIQDSRWPPGGFLHCRGILDPLRVSLPKTHNLSYFPSKKLKETEVQVPDSESVLYALQRYSQLQASRLSVSFQCLEESVPGRKPRRIVMTGPELQERVRKNIISKLPDGVVAQDAGSLNQSTLRDPQSQSSVSAIHPALAHIFQGIATSLTPFDKFECEVHDWAHKYAPRSASHILQQGRECTLLRNWLKSLTITSVGSGNSDRSESQESSLALKKGGVRAKRKRAKAEELDGFIISSEDEANEMDELTNIDDISPTNLNFGLKKSMIRSGDNPKTARINGGPSKATNAVIISGPHGCGKTAAVYAVASELGFEVFEINAGSRRSGKDIMDKVGDVARNHLVHQVTNLDDLKKSEEFQVSIDEDIANGRQSTINFLMKPKGKSQPGLKGKKAVLSKLEKPQKKPKQQKQSLILLEEVDLLFEEDKQFWTAALDLMSQSKRPIIMTCTDESRLPLGEMILHAIFRFTPPPEQLATDYLILIAANEGHILSQKAVNTLYMSKHLDLRASITELNFWCQMAIGDSKGGLEWMLISSNASECHNKQGQRLRVVSCDSYLPGMGFLSHESSETEGMMYKDLDLLTQAFENWDIDVEDWAGLVQMGHTPIAQQLPSQSSLKQLNTLDAVFDALSATDVLLGWDFRQDEQAPLDTSPPELTQKELANYIEGYHLLHANPLQDQTGLSISLPLAVKASSRSLLLSEVFDDCASLPFNEEAITQGIIQKEKTVHSNRGTVKAAMEFAFSPLIEPKAAFLMPKGPQITCFDGPMSSITEDVAPYVRSIASYDLRLEGHRLHLSNLLSQGGRNGKRARTTRASRAALEGGSKANIRRERWFPTQTNLPLIFKTGGEGWQEVVVRRQGADNSDKEERYEGSRRSSVGATAGEE